ncbi:MAG: cobalamin B12-binding domain-containing protein [Deltaproteobacteria bacterium]|nr:cobalamin B12-binding domain-containing protein [Deltaproteobacteria bacterium]
MKLLFLTPPMGNWVRWGQKHIACNPLHSQLAAFVREKNTAEVKVLDCRALEVPEEEMLQRIGEESPDAVFLGTRLVTDGGASPIVRYLEAFTTIKESFPRIITIMAGLGVSAIPEELLGLAPQLDYLVIGEAEETLVELLRELKTARPKFDQIRGLAFRDGSRIVVTAPRPLLPDLNELPMPAYDLFPMDRHIGFSRIEHYNEAVTSRGCEGACSFCYEWGLIDPRSGGDFLIHRARSGKLVADEMELLNKKYGVKALNLLDDDFNSERQKMLDLLDELEKRDLDIEWFFMGRARNLIRDADLIPRMRKAGCYQVLFGIEAGTDQELVHIRKSKERYTIADLKELVRLLRQNDIATVGTYMSGFWEDDADKIEHRFRVVDEIDPDCGVLMLLTPMPGSPIWRQALKESRIETLELENWDAVHTIMPTRHLSREELSKISAWANREFFNKPHRIERICNGYTSPYVRMKFETYKATAHLIDQ